MRKQHKISQNSKEWHDLRLGKFTSSDIADLFVDPKTKKDKENGVLSSTAMSLVERKANDLFYGTPSPNIGSYATEWGHDNEPIAKQAYTQVTGIGLSGGNFWTLGDDTGSSPDDMALNNELVIEIKCPYNRDNHAKNVRMLKDDTDLYWLSKKYYYQVHHQMYVTGAKWCDFISFDPRLLEHEDHYNKAIHIIRIDRNDELCNEFESRIKKAVEVRDSILKQLLA